ncbi:hypothetical protein YFHUAIHA_CDS0070 [Phage C48C1]|nr:hypothetical protein YFHUAIHA_CDS0070 [Phage C48C1]
MRYSGPADRIASDIKIIIDAAHFRYQSKFSGYQLRSGLVRPSALTIGSPRPALGIYFISSPLTTIAIF